MRDEFDVSEVAWDDPSFGDRLRAALEAEAVAASTVKTLLERVEELERRVHRLEERLGDRR